MNNNLNKFIEVYFNIINEAWDRYLYRDVIMAVGIATNYGKDPWIKGESGRKVLEKIKELAFHTKGSKLISLSSVSETQYEGSSLFDGGYVYNYWKFRASKGDQYAINTFNLISSIDPMGDQQKPRDVLATEIGLVSYAIWKAMNAKATRIEKNEQEVTEKKLTDIYQAGTKVINKKFIIKDVYTDVNQYSGHSLKVLVGEDPETNIKVKLKSTSKEIQKLGYEIFHAKDKNVLDEIIPLEITVSKATVSKFDIQWKTAVFSKIELANPTLDEINELGKKIYNLIKEKPAKEEAAKKEEWNKKSDEEKVISLIKSIFDMYKNDFKKEEQIRNVFVSLKAIEKDGKISDIDAEVFIKIFKEMFKNEFNKELE